MNEKSECVQLMCEEKLGRKLNTEEAFVLGLTYAVAFGDGKLEAIKEIGNFYEE